MNTPDILEVDRKIKKVRDYLDDNGYDAIILGRQDNFAWITDGGENKLVHSSEYGSSIIIITADKKYMIAGIMDARRVMEDELEGLGFENLTFNWFEMTAIDKATEIIKGITVLSDMPIDGIDFIPDKIYKLHYPLTEKEIKRYRELGQKADEVLTKVANETRPGMSEYEIQAALFYEFSIKNIKCNISLVGTDDRIFKYRHPLPSNKKLEKYLLMALVPSKWGLNVPLSRLVYFGDNIPEEIEKKYDAACQIATAALSMCIPGTRFIDILEMQKELYKKFGYEDEWKNHYQGGVTGYQIADIGFNLDSKNLVQSGEAYTWFTTISGVKSEETSLNLGDRRKIITLSGAWPVKEYEYSDQKYKLPIILQK